MKKRVLFLTGCIFFIGLVFAGGQTIQNSPAKEGCFTLISSDINTSVFHYTPVHFTLKTIETGRGAQQIPVMEGGFPFHEKGSPDLLRSSVSLIIPENGAMDVQILSSSYKEYNNIEIAPSRGVIYICQDATKIPYEFGEVYQKDAFFPGKIAEAREPHIMRSVRGQVIDIYPFQYNPVKKILRVYYDIQVKTSVIENGQSINPLNTKSNHLITHDFDRIYAGTYLNYDNYRSERALKDNANGRMLVIYYNSFLTELQPWIDWKIQKGIEVDLVDVSTFSDAAAIKTYVTNFYNSHTDFCYLVLVGDFAQVTSTTVTSISGYDSSMDPGPYAADNKYTLISGSDNYPEIISGRISAESANDVKVQVTKFLTYEKTPKTMSTDKFDNAAVMSLRLGPDNQTEVYLDMRAAKNTLTGAGYESCKELYEDNVGDMSPTASNISAQLNSGVGYMSWICHGQVTGLSSFSFSNSNVNSLTNTGMWPMIWNCSCLTGKFHKTSICFAETWMRANTNGAPKGAIGTAMSNLLMSMGCSEKLGNGAAQRLVSTTNKNKTYGWITYDTYIKLALQDYNQPNEFVYMCIFTDPSLVLRTKAPMDLTATHNNQVDINDKQFTVNCTIENAYVSLTIGNNIIGTGYISGGVAAIQLEPITTGNKMKVTVTAFNYVPYISEVNIITNSPPVADFSSAIKNNCKGTVQFTDKSSGVQTWAWNFGDGTTSTDQNPLHTYLSNGTYTVTLSVTNNFGNDSKVNTVQVAKTAYVNPVNGKGCEGETVSLTASGAGTLSWYDALTGGNLITTGTTYTTPALSKTATYYIESMVQDPPANVGKAVKATTGGGFFTGNDYRGLVFDVLAPMTLKSVKVYANTAGNRVIEVLDAPQTGNMIVSKTVNIPAGESRVTLDFKLQPGSNYHLKVTGAGTSVDLHRDTEGGAYPYNVSNVVSILYSNTDDANQYAYYYFFYDWEVQKDGCTSDRVPVKAEIFPNPGKPLITSNGPQLSTTTGFASYQWYLNGSPITNANNNTFTPLQNGDYTVEITDQNGCSNISDPYILTTINNVLEYVNSMTIKPNPFNNQTDITITLNKTSQVKLSVYTILGKELLTLLNKNIQTGKHELVFKRGNLTPGVYFLNLTINDQVITSRIVITP